MNVRIICRTGVLKDRTYKNISVNWTEKELGGYSGGVPPLPIPNREVKPSSADGTT